VEAASNRALSFLLILRFYRPRSATPVFSIPDEIVPGSLSLKGLNDLIDAARKKRGGVRRGGKLLDLAVEMGMTV
jgi:hypothetical protein